MTIDEAVAHEGPFDEALERFHRTGPEFEGWLSNHGPMAVEALARNGHDAQIHAWTDDYLNRLDERPRGLSPITPEGWRDPLGDPLRTGDWIDFFLREVRERPWRDVLDIWWPRLLPGIAAGATHGVIRVGHAVAALEVVENEPRIEEFGHALAYWAARWLPVPVVRPQGGADPAAAISGVPAVGDQRFGIRSRIAQLDDEFASAAAKFAAGEPGQERAKVEQIADAAVAFYATHGHGQPTMLVHAATAPNAVARVMPLLRPEHQRPSLEAAWTATAAVVAAYRPAAEVSGQRVPATPEEVIESAAAHGGEHVIKFADTAVRSYQRTGSADALAAAQRAIELDA
ncbi:questin oxidase family protein [Calidifontibacter sp. DB0510]|uniref:Questin oxidase family protein n=1 Tax=Metallococcus carri TaxID=1656884 RepID=A0A967B0C1_9MICO|nr:questin oxidase family protein [Metallococcus carri]NHN55689.1 questin oxidase family protein [Metallococcus carri]NOP38622.1 DUF4243 domain-containing protein [Calidifontibacter sp. DB2511S]